MMTTFDPKQRWEYPYTPYGKEDYYITPSFKNVT